MIGNNVNFGNKKSKKVTKIDDIDVNEISVSKEIYLNTLLDAMIMMLLDHCAQSFHKSLAMLENLIVLQQCPLGLATNNC